MKIIELLLVIVLFSLFFITYYYWKQQQKLEKKRNKNVFKYELLELTSADKEYDEYYEPEIIEIVSSDEYL